MALTKVLARIHFGNVENCLRPLSRNVASFQLQSNWKTSWMCQGRNYSKKSKARPDSSSSSSSDSDSSSDGDNKLPYGKRGQSEFWRKKMRTHHHAIDINKDGTVSWDDFEDMARKFVEVGNLNPAQQHDFIDALKQFWEQYWGASSDPYAFVMAEDFMKSMDHVINSKELSKKVGMALPFFFKAVDHDQSGEISVEEYKIFFKCLGLDEKAAVESFAAIDENGDGLLSLDEFVLYGKEFFLSEDETRGSKLFWGPLAN